MTQGVSRGPRAAVAVVVGMALAFGAFLVPGASADLQSFSSSSQGFALRVTVDLSGLPDEAKALIDTAFDALPDEAKGDLTGFPYVVDQTFIKSSADAAPNVTNASAVLVEGNLRNQPATEASQIGQSNNDSVQTIRIPDQDGLSVINATAGVLTTAVSDGPKVNAEATLAEVAATLQNVSSLLPQELQDLLEDLVDEVNAVLATATGQVSQTVEDSKDTIFGALPGELTGLLGDAGIDEDTLSLDVVVPDLDNVLDVNLATVEELVNQSTSQRSGDMAVADALTNIKSMSILGGFLSVGVIDLMAHSEADGTPGSAKVDSACTIADVRLGDTAGVSLDGTKLYVDVAGQPVAVPVVGDDTIADLKAQVDEVLDAAGISVHLCDEAQGATAADGTSASKSVSAFVVEFAPRAPADVAPLGIAAGDELVKVTIDPTVQTAVMAAQAEPAPAPAAPQPPAALPRTGASVLITMLAGLGLVGGALAARRFAR